VKNTSILSSLNVECVSKDAGVEVNVKNATIKPGETGTVEIKSNLDGKNFELNLNTSNLDKTVKLKTQKDYFNNNGFVYNDDYKDDPIWGDIVENKFYKNSSIKI
jgi:hypothetical protein